MVNGVSIWHIALLLIPLVCGQTCNIVRDVTACPEGSLKQELACLMRQNSLRTIMDCIQIKNSANVNNEKVFCRLPSNGIKDNNEAYSDSYYWKNTKGAICLKPRTIILKGPLQTIYEGFLLSMAGAIDACPDYDDDFHNCLCEQNVNAQSLLQLAQLFKPSANQDLSCPKFTKRTSFLDDVVQGPHMHQARDDIYGDVSFDSAYNYNFTINRFGQPVYWDNSIGYRLPYFDEYMHWPGVDEYLARRCYVHPEEAEVATCRTWLYSSTATPIYSATPTRASYKRVFTGSLSGTPTATVAPDTTAIPTTPLQVTSEVATEASAPTASPTTGTSNAESVFRKTSVARSCGLALLMIAGTLAL